jgi:hypothetical protein
MKQKYFYCLVIALLCMQINAKAQQLVFSYDLAGNQISRQWICVNCPLPRTAEKIAESIPLKIETKLIDSAKQVTYKRTVTASPNPFLENLNVTWQVENEISVKNITVFNISGMKMVEVNPLPNYNNLTIPFQRFATGMYILYITFSDQTKESIKVIKK